MMRLSAILQFSKSFAHILIKMENSKILKASIYATFRILSFQSCFVCIEFLRYGQMHFQKVKMYALSETFNPCHQRIMIDIFHNIFSHLLCNRSVALHFFYYCTLKLFNRHFFIWFVLS